MKRRKRIVYMSVTLAFITWSLILYGWRQRVDEEFVDLSSCPACYGENICGEILQQDSPAVTKIQLTGGSSLKVMKIMNYKNVYYGDSESERVVFKKLAHDSEFEKFDREVCGFSRHSAKCNVSESMDYLVRKYERDIVRAISDNPSVFVNDGIICNHTRVVKYLFDEFVKIDSGPHHHHHFLTILAINAEPLIINAFRDSKWFPSLLGMCGRVIVEKYEGPTLSQLTHVSWLERADFARQLLEMTFDFSHHSEFRLYLTDVSLDNFAVDAEGNVKVIDAENIIIVDSSKLGLDTRVNINSGIGCPNCLSFAIEDLCGHTLADHNFFAVCKGLLSSSAFSRDLPEGLLYSPPAWVTHLHPSLHTHIEDCAGGHTRFPNRSQAAKHLHSLLISVIRKALKDS